MRSNCRLILTEEAEGDLRSILAFSLENWGNDRRDIYAERVTNAMNELLTHPQLGRTQDDIFTGLRSRLVGQHVIYYLIDEPNIAIIRILHVKMDPTRHLHSLE